MFPGAAVIGTDLAPIQPDYIPPNLAFMIDDIEDEWTWGQKFDYIYTRDLDGVDWVMLSRRAHAFLILGGYFEVVGHYILVEDDTPPGWRMLKEIFCSFQIGRKGLTFEATNADCCERGLNEAGFELVRNMKHTLLLNPEERCGYLFLDYIIEKGMGVYARGLEQLGRADARLVRQFGHRLWWEASEYNVLIKV